MLMPQSNTFVSYSSIPVFRPERLIFDAGAAPDAPVARSVPKGQGIPLKQQVVFVVDAVVDRGTRSSFIVRSTQGLYFEQFLFIINVDRLDEFFKNCSFVNYFVFVFHLFGELKQ